ncbi:hypothetical protein OHB12_01805 [Nocardia sp. NBC_01730]|uniref:hypothetical protein n=1 Tax=Nocardia sp. NBC_01730 TaxID=2975998 RepID=UPI002E127DE9|nr:hypothetical protein OHB12_01805 [Nocardia sp. NBC_01730]
MSLGNRWAVSVPQVIHMVWPSLAVILACLLGRSRSSTLSASTALALLADLYSIRHSVFSPNLHAAAAAEPVDAGACDGFGGVGA